MAFSYSDKNFTVIGNLCFVHFYVETQYTDIPPAIADRMLLDDFTCVYLGNSANNVIMPFSAHFKSGKIECDNIGYLYCYFPIDSNK